MGTNLGLMLQVLARILCARGWENMSDKGHHSERWQVTFSGEAVLFQQLRRIEGPRGGSFVPKV